ncbi:histidine kinase HHK3 [Xylariales sp. PMI_506]|nr:histidine kinase HHK3 [Xylariales sp. PMI_506]
MSFFPKADAAVLQSRHEFPKSRPNTVGPIFDTAHVDTPLSPWSSDFTDANYPKKSHEYAAASVPEAPDCQVDQYLFPVLTRNERLRLTMLWYYTRHILEDTELLSRLQEKSNLAQESIGWEFAIVGLLDINTYQRLATSGLPLAILPRRESTCAHTVNQPPGTVFLLTDMKEDWRFSGSPHVDIGGLRSYAGVPLRFDTEFGECVAFGSLCVASNSPQAVLSREQQVTLARLADWVVADIIHSKRSRRQRERWRMAELIGRMQSMATDTAVSPDDAEKTVMEALGVMYPNANISVQVGSRTGMQQLSLEGRYPIQPQELEDGLWVDIEYLDGVIKSKNCIELPTSRVIRVIAAPFDDTSSVPAYLVVASKEFKLIFDDADSWFVQTCAGLLLKLWHNRLLAETLMAKEKFLRGITHQLRTPIHGILGATELLAEILSRSSTTTSIQNASPVEKIARSPLDLTTASKTADPFFYVDTIKTAGRELISIINSMITLNRWTDVAQMVRTEALYSVYDLEAELLSDISLMNPHDGRRYASIFFHSELPKHCDSISIDFNLFKSSLLPLIINALQNTAPDGIVKITSSVEADYSELRFDVEDTGNGIQPHHQQRIFEAFEKVDVHSIGAGLGLTLASKFVQLLGGTVELVSSEPGRGSHFRATFRDFGCACLIDSSKSRQEMGSTTDRSYKYQYIPAESSNCGSVLSHHMTKYLESKGYAASSGTNQDSLIIFDDVPDSKDRLGYYSAISDDQVAVCLVAAPSLELDDEYTAQKNIIHVREPFTTSTLTNALEMAARLVAETRIKGQNTDQPVPDPEEADALAADQAKVGQVDSKVLSECAVNATLTPIYPTLTIREPTPSKPAAALLVDDNSVNLRVLQMYCNKRGLPYFCATNGKQAVEIFSRHQSLASAPPSNPTLSDPTAITAPIELIFMDLQMPVCDGIEATRQIRRLEHEQQKRWGRRSVMFIITGQDSTQDRVDAERAGADDYFVKPVGVKVLDRGIGRYFPGFVGAT